MKKTSTRLATAGGIAVLCACAIALAQHDSRNRQREQPLPRPVAAEPAQPIAADSLGPGWESQAAQTDSIVRANNDILTSYARKAPTEAGPEPEGMQLPEFDAVVAASAEESGAPAAAADESPGLSNPPPWAMSPGQSAPAALPTLGATALAPTSDAAPPAIAPQLPPSVPSLPTMGVRRDAQGPSVEVGANQLRPQLPDHRIQDNSGQTAMQSYSSPPSGASPRPLMPHLPDGAAGANAFASTMAPVSDMSDTQRGVMQPTSLLPTDGGAPARSAPTGPLSSSSPAAAGLPSIGSSVTGNRQNFPQEFTRPGQPAGDATALGPNPQPAEAASNLAVPRSNLGNSAAPLPSGFRQEPPRGMANGGAAAVRSESARAVASLVGLVSDEPGMRFLDGSQSPNPQIEKRAPEEIQVGKKATFVIVVRNVGNATAHDVTVVDKVPRGARFADADPPVSPTPDGILVWNLGEVSAGDERVIRLNIIPEVEGEMGSTASVHFAAQASVRTIATLPKLQLTLESQPEVLIGNFQPVIVTIRNIGTGVARNVSLEVDVPEQLRHDSGVAQLQATVGDLSPNQERRFTNLAFTAVQPGQGNCQVRAVTPDGIQAEATAAVDVRAPRLAATIDGPKTRYLERHATYTFTVHNAGTAAATNLDFSVQLPAGLDYISTDVSEAAYDPSTHTVHLGLNELQPGQPAPFNVTVLPTQLGSQGFSVKATADLGLSAEAQGQVNVEGLAELAFELDQDSGTIETGASTTYTVKVRNVGSKPDRNVQLTVQLPAGSSLLNTSPQAKQSGDQIHFDPVAELPTGDHRIFRFEIQHNQSGTRVVHTKLISQNLGVGVVKEVGTLVYDDGN